MISVVKEVTALLRFLKKLFQFGKDESISASLMEKARASALLNENHFSAPDLTSEGLTQFFHDNEELEQLQLQQIINEHHQQSLLFQQQMEENMLHQQQLQDMHDPYQNPGQDIVVDEHYHHIDHGLD